MSQEKKMELVDLEPLLQKHFDNKKLKLVDYVATNLLSSGENYCSLMVKLEITIQRTENSSEEIVHYVAKTSHKSTTQHLLDWRISFEKELFIYKELLPIYRDLEREVGIEENNLIDILPTFIGYRRSLKENSNDIDGDALLLMENMITKGFYVCDRQKGMDFEHSSKALASLARYHALGIALKHKRPYFRETVIKQNRVHVFNLDVAIKAFKGVLKVYRETPCLQKNLDIIEECFKMYIDCSIIKKPYEGLWTTISHGDFWVNNILFHKDEETGKVDDVKFVDFQMSKYCSAVRDVLYFIGGSLSDATLKNHLDDLLNIYYEHFIESLRNLGCDMSPFTKEAFNAELKKESLTQFPMITLANKFFSYEVEEEDQDNKELHHTIFHSKVSEKYMHRIKRLIEVYERKGWF